MTTTLAFLLAFLSISSGAFVSLTPKVTNPLSNGNRKSVRSADVFPTDPIVGGEMADKFSAMHTARLNIQFPTFSGVCTGSILNKKTILTAAHCVLKEGESAIAVEAEVGAIRLRWSRQYSSINMYIHPDYCDTESKRDIAVITFERNFSQKKTKAVKIWKTGLKINEKVQATGFGRTNGSDPTLPSVLQKVDLVHTHRDVCTGTWWPPYRLRYTDDSHVFCTMDRGTPGQANKGICFGDSGGPLFVVRNGKFVQYGISSFLWGYGCVGPEVSHWFTNIHAFRTMVKEAKNGNFSQWYIL